MIERAVINGKSATVAYLKGDFQPAEKQDYTFMKVIFDNGDVVFARKENANDQAPN